MSDTEKEAVKEYNNPKKGYWGKTKMMAKYRKILKNMYALQRHREIKAHMIRRNMRHIKAPRPFYSVQVDLGFWDVHKKQNDGVIGLLVVIDVFSRYLWVKKVYNKKSLHIPLKSVIDEMKHTFDQTPLNMTGDNEFATTKLQALAAEYNFHWYFGDAGEKYRTGIVERVIRTLRNLIKRYQAQNNTTRYVDVLNDLVENYNNTVHRVINKKPIDALKTGKVNDKRKEKTIPELNKGEKVRIQEIRKKGFTKGDVPYYSKDVFHVSGRDGNRYILKDDDGNVIPKRYGRSQLYHIDRVIGPNNKDKKSGYDDTIAKNKRSKRNKRALNRMGIDLNNIIDPNERKKAKQDVGYESPPPPPRPAEIRRMDLIDDAIQRLRNRKGQKRRIHQLKQKKNKENPSVSLPKPSIPVKIPDLPSSRNIRDEDDEKAETSEVGVSNRRMKHLRNQLDLYKRSKRPNARRMVQQVRRNIDKEKRSKRKRKLPPLPKRNDIKPLPPIPKGMKLPPLPPLPKQRSKPKRKLPPLPRLPPIPERNDIKPLPPIPKGMKLPPLPPLPSRSLRRSSRMRKKPDRYKPPDNRKIKKKKKMTTKQIAQHMSRNLPKFNAIRKKRKKHKSKK